MMKHKKRYKNLKQNKGITLIALVVTIIVLLILAGVSIQMLTGQTGILTQASNAKIKDAHGKVAEALKLDAAEYMLDKNNGVTTKGLIEYLQEKGLIDENLVIKTDNLVGSNLATGKGEGTIDVYKLEKSESKEGIYDIVYYDKDGTKEELGELENSGGGTENIEENDPIVDILSANLIVKRSGKVILLNNEPPEETHKVVKLTNLNDGKIITESGIITYSLEKIDGAYRGVTVFVDGENKVYEYEQNSNSVTCISDIEGHILQNKKIVKVLNTEVAIDEQGKLYVWGVGLDLFDGTRPHPNNKGVCLSDIEGHILQNKKIINISEDCAVDEEGKVYTWSVMKSIRCISDIEGNALNGKVVKDIYTKGVLLNPYYYAIDEEGKAYKWNEEESITCINDIKGSALNEKIVKSIYFGSVGDYAIDEDGKLYEWDIGESGGLLNRKTESPGIPVCITDLPSNVLSGKKILKVFGDDINYYCYTLVIDEMENIYAYGIDLPRKGRG